MKKSEILSFFFLIFRAKPPSGIGRKSQPWWGYNGTKCLSIRQPVHYVCVCVCVLS